MALEPFLISQERLCLQKTGGLVLKKLTAKRKEKLANDIRALLSEYGLDIYASIYFNRKCMKGNGVIEDGKRASKIFKYATDDTISMSFESDLYEVFNSHLESLAAVFIPRFTKLLESYGLFYELGDAWNLGTYYRKSPEDTKNQEGGDSENPIYITKSDCPEELEEIRASWEARQNEYGDVGSAVIGAGFTFKFLGKFYKMRPQGRWQGSLSWESSVNAIKQMLIDALCENVVFHDGVIN